MHSTRQIPVLIVGSGAAGTLLALELARHGVEFRCVDRLPQPSHYSRAVTVHARTLEMLARIDEGLLQRFLARGIHSPGYVMHYVDAAGTRREVRPGLDFTQLDSRYPFLLLHGQDDTEAHLRALVQERYGRSTEWGVTCTHVVQTGDRIIATLQDGDGVEDVVECQYLIACDGANSRLRQQLQWEQDGSEYAGTVLQNLDIHLQGFPDDPDWVHYCMGPAHFVMVVKLPDGHFRLLMSQPADKAAPDAVPEQVFGNILDQHFDGVHLGEAVWHSRWGSRIHLARHYRKGNVFLAGDAAHVHSTAGGQGMNCCLQDAYNLGWKLAYVLQGKAPATLLDSYEQERKPIGRQVIAAASAIHTLFMAGRNSDPAELLALRASGQLQSLVAQVSGLGYHYRSEATATLPGLQVGDRLPDLALPQGSLYALSRHPRHVLVLASAGRLSAAARALLTQALAPYGAVLQPLTVEQAPAALLDAGADQLLLVRPDGYLALRAPLLDTAALTAYAAEHWLC